MLEGFLLARAITLSNIPPERQREAREASDTVLIVLRIERSLNLGKKSRVSLCLIPTATVLSFLCPSPNTSRGCEITLGVRVLTRDIWRAR
jgi:hypothetical protein